MSKMVLSEQGADILDLFIHIEGMHEAFRATRSMFTTNEQLEINAALKTLLTTVGRKLGQTN